MNISSLDPKWRLLFSWILFGALVLAALIYLVVGYIAVVSGEVKPAGLEPMVKYILAAVGALVAVSSYPLKAALLSRPGAWKGRNGIPLDPAAKTYIAMVFALCLCEAAALIGGVIAFLAGDLVLQTALTTVSLLAMAGHFPRAEADMGIKE